MGKTREKFVYIRYNESQKRTQNAAFLQMSRNERKDTVAQCAERVNSASMGLMISPELIRATFIKGLPTRLQAYNYGINGTYDDLVGAVGNISGILNRSLAFGRFARTSMIKRKLERIRRG